MGSQNQRRRCVLALTGIVVVCEVHAAWKSAHTLCNVCAGFYIMYIHEIGEEEKSIQCIICMCSFLKGGGVGEKRLAFVSKKISVFTDDAKCKIDSHNCLNENRKKSVIGV